MWFMTCRVGACRHEVAVVGPCHVGIDLVHQQQESILDVLLAVGGGLAALFMGITVAHQGAGVDGTAHYLRYTAAEKFALVLSSLQAASPVQRDRY